MEHVTLTNIARGIAPQLFGRELDKVLENIGDTRTSPVKQRKITLEFIFKPDQERHTVEVEVKAKSTLAEGSGVKGLVFTSLDAEQGLRIITLNDPKQLTLADQLNQKKKAMGGE